MLGVPVALQDLVAVDLRDRVALLAETVVAVDAHQHEGREDQQEQEDLHDLVVGADEFEHGFSFLANKTKGELPFAFFALGGC